MSNVTVAPHQVLRLMQVLFLIQMVSMGAMEMSGPFWPIHLKTLNSSDLLFGFASSAVYIGPMLGILLTSAFWGRMGDRFGHKPMMIRALLGLSLTQLALAYSNDVWTILMLRFVQGACAGYIAPAQAYSVSIESPTRRVRLFAYLQVSTNLGSLVGAMAGGLILDYATFFWINIIASVLCVTCAAAVALILPSVPALKAASSATQSSDHLVDNGLPPIWRSSPILGLIGILGILLVSRMIIQTPLSLYVRSVFEVSNWVVGLCYGLLALGFVVSALLWARHFEEKSLADALRRMTYVAMVCASLMVLAGMTRNVGVFIAIHFAWGVLLGATTPMLMSLISKAAGTLQQGYILGVTQSIVQFSSIVGIALGGWLSHIAGLQYTYFYVSFSYFLAVIVLVAMRRGHVATRRAGISAGL